MSIILTLARYLVFAAFSMAVLAAFGSWLVRTRRVSPSGATGRLLRHATDPVIRPVETRLVKLGANPVLAGWWLVVVVAIVGVVGLSLLGWGLQTAAVLGAALAGGPRALFVVAVGLVYGVLVIALVVRVVGSWLGAFRYSRLMRPAYWLTDWIVNPIHRLLPPAGMFDLSPLAAWFVLWVLRQVLLGVVT